MVLGSDPTRCSGLTSRRENGALSCSDNQREDTAGGLRASLRRRCGVELCG